MKPVEVVRCRAQAAPSARNLGAVLAGAVLARFAGCTDARVAALLSYKKFLATYDDARETWTSGRAATFPPGTYWLARFAPVSVAPLPS